MHAKCSCHDNRSKTRYSRWFKLKASVLGLTLAGAGFGVQADLARVGPANIPSPPGHGFPAWYQDLNGMVLDLCLPNGTNAAQQAACLFAPPNPNAVWAFTSNFPDEAFFYDISNPAINLQVPAGSSGSLSYLMALEAAFATGGPVAGQQIVFARVRIRAGVPVPGTYTVTHPYGVETFQVDTAGGNRDINFTDDVGIAPGVFTGALRSRLGPFLQHADAPGGTALPPIRIPATTGPQFLGDGATPGFVTGSPFGTDYIMVCAVDSQGQDIPLGNFTLPDNTVTQCAGSDQFTLVGRLRNLATNPIGSPLSITQATYGRDAAGTHVDVYANAIKAIPTQANPVLTAASANQPPVLMTATQPLALGNYYVQGITDPSGAIPNAATVINSADSPPSTATKNVVDVVSIRSANYASGTDTLTVVAASSDKGFGSDSPPPTLALEGYPDAVVSGASNPAGVTLTATSVTMPPASVTVLSSAGGIGRADVTGDLDQTVPSPFEAGVVFAQDDFVPNPTIPNLATLTAGGDPVDIPVLDNDVSNTTAPPTPSSISILAPGLPAANGTLAVGTGSNGIPLGIIRFTPSAAVGEFTFRYTVANAVGRSNPATVTLNVAPGTGGPMPIANADPGPNNVNPNAAIAVNVLANDSGNGGTLNPASVQVANVTGGTIGAGDINATTGAVTFHAGAAAGTFGFDYTVANTNGNPSGPAHVTVTIVSEQIAVTTNRCTRSGNNGQWNVRGTDNIFPGTVITLFASGTAGSGTIIGTTTVDATGGWRFTQTVPVACRSPISLRSSLGTFLNAINIRIQ